MKNLNVNTNPKNGDCSWIHLHKFSWKQFYCIMAIYVFLAVPIAYSVHLRKSYETTKGLLTSVDYKRYEWKHVFKVIAFLLRMQLGFTNCFLRKSRAILQHSLLKSWPSRRMVGENHILYESVVDRKNTYLYPFHLKLRLNFVKAMDCVEGTF